MLVSRLCVRALLLFLCLGHGAVAQVVLEDDGVSVSRGELDFIIRQWTDQMKKAAANDTGDRLELLNKVIILKKMAAAADNTPEATQAYWQLGNDVTIAKRNFIFDNFVDTLQIPDMSALAAERYQTERRKYAFVGEKRISSHILFVCPRADESPCTREGTAVEAQGVLDQLRAGADFEEMVQAHSGDSGTKQVGGKFDRWIAYGQPEVAAPYSQGLFQIEQIGDYSELVKTQFGIHIIRYDGVQEEYFLPYEEVEQQIVAYLSTEYRRLSISKFLEQFNMTDTTFIDGEAMEAIFAPYKRAEN